MRVFIINANWGKGGPGGIAADLYDVMTRNGHICRFAYGRGSIPSGVSAYRIGGALNVYCHAVAARVFDNAGFMSGHATEGLIRDIERFKPDIISVQNPLGYTLHVERLFGYIRESGIPTFWTIHDCWAVTGHCIFGLCDHWKTGCGRCPQKSEYPKSVMLDRSASNFARKRKALSGIRNLHLITPSDWIKRLLEDTYMREYPITVIRNGIDLSVFRPVDSDLRKVYEIENKRVLLAVASVWSERKGGNYLQRLMRDLDESYVMVVIGKCGEKYTDGTERMIYIERTEDRNQLAEWYSTADVFVNPTVGDNFPTVNLEALACGTPVVTFDTGGSGEPIGNCGAVVDPANIDELHRAVENCIERRIPPEDCVAQASYYDKNDRYKDYMKLFQLKLIMDEP